MKIGITGASGPLGRAAAEFVLQTVDGRELVLGTRNPASLTEFAARGVEVRHVDFADPSTLASAFRGVDRLLLISTDAVGARLDAHRAAISAASRAGVTHVVYTSIPRPVPANPALVVSDHAGTEQALYDSGLDWTVLRNNLYSHLQVPVIEHAGVSGRLVSNSADGTVAYVTREDCAAAAAAVLTQNGHEGLAYDITGPESLSAAALAILAGEVGRRDVGVIEVSDTEFSAGLRTGGLTEQIAELLTSFGAAARGGFLTHVSSAVADLTGRAPTRFADVIWHHEMTKHSAERAPVS